MDTCIFLVIEMIYCTWILYHLIVHWVHWVHLVFFQQKATKSQVVYVLSTYEFFRTLRSGPTSLLGQGHNLCKSARSAGCKSLTDCLTRLSKVLPWHFSSQPTCYCGKIRNRQFPSSKPCFVENIWCLEFFGQWNARKVAQPFKEVLLRRQDETWWQAHTS